MSGQTSAQVGAPRAALPPDGTYEGRLARFAAADPRIVVMTAENRAAIRNLPAALGDRFIDVGICEQTMVGAAAGLALRGRIPVVHALATFLTLRAFEFIRTDVGIPGLPVKLIGGVAGLLSEANGPTHQAIEDLALMRGIPGMDVICPCDESELLDALPLLLASGRPTYVRYHAAPVTVAHTQPYALGRAEWLGPTPKGPADVVLVGCGLLIPQLVDAAAHLTGQGVSARVLNLRTLSPVDDAALAEAARAPLLVTVEDHFLIGGLRSLVAERIAEHGWATRLVGLGFDARWWKPALLPQAMELAGLTGVQIATRVHAALVRVAEKGTHA